MTENEIMKLHYAAAQACGRLLGIAEGMKVGGRVGAHVPELVSSEISIIFEVLQRLFDAECGNNEN